jgi:hypothetical protein
MQTKIQVRRGTAQQWADADTVLDSGEIGFETDTGLFKIGNGSATWTALGYAGGNGGGASSEVRSDFLDPHSYIGVAPAGSLTSASVWKVSRIDIGPPVVTETASAVKWDDRLTATYS